ncbi:uncharacterized protein LOC133911306 [Phragmites australis]|uniref:uncharacterized protein LOC133911306 n=1 Tax=Phragmites australis TaxID=29695 RepID=UPI002D79D035|nr:uncharacterized protein LOC133911306 [Phragmites australis]
MAALPRAALLLIPLLLATKARSQDESPISLAPASAPTASHLHPDSVADSESARSPISQPPASSSPSAAPADDIAHSPPAPPETSPFPAPSVSPAQAPSYLPPTHPRSATPAPAPAAEKEADGNKDKDDDKPLSSPAPAPTAAEMKAASGTGDGEAGSHEELNGGKKAGVVVGAFTAAAVVGLGAFVWKKRRANIRRARYAEYSARLELV